MPYDKDSEFAKKVKEGFLRNTGWNKDMEKTDSAYEEGDATSVKPGVFRRIKDMFDKKHKGPGE